MRQALTSCCWLINGLNDGWMALLWLLVVMDSLSLSFYLSIPRTELVPGKATQLGLTVLCLRTPTTRQQSLAAVDS